MSSAHFLTEELAREVDEAVACIVAARGLTLFGLVESLRDRITSKSAIEREAGFKKLVGVVMTLPNGLISGEEATYLLNFLLPRVEDSGHVADSLISGIHHLLRRTGTSLSSEFISHAVTVLFQGNNVQAYATNDRLLLFDLMEHFLDAHLEAVRALGPQQFVLLFVRSANSERDPRCLLRIFRVFLKVVDHFALGALTEDMFELVACYYPIEYEPSETDVGHVDKKMLMAGCEACLLAHSSFSTYCFQLVAEKLMEESAPGESDKLEIQLVVCAFLGRACRAFVLRSTYGAIRQNLEDYLASLRLIFFNPVQTSTSLDRTAVTVGEMLKGLTANMQECSDSAEEDFKLLATNMLESRYSYAINFHSEMGLTEKALRLLALIADCNQITFELIVPKALYWLNLLLQGSTIKSPENKKEIAEETLELLPEWVRRGAYLIKVNGEAIGTVDQLQKATCDLLSSMDAVRTFCDAEKVLKAKFTASKFLCTVGQLSSADQLYDEVTSNDYIGDFGTARHAAEDFVSAYVRSNPQKCLAYLRSLTNGIESTSKDRVDMLLAILPSFANQSLEATMLVTRLLLQLADKSANPQLWAAIEKVLKNCPPTVIDSCVEALKPFYELILTGPLNEEAKMGIARTHFINIANTLRQRSRPQLDSFAEWMLLTLPGGSNSAINEKLLSIISPVFQQLESERRAVEFWDLLVEQYSGSGSEVPSTVQETLLSLHFCIINRHGFVDTEAETSQRSGRRRSRLVQIVGSQLLVCVCEANAQLMNSSQGGVILVKQLFDGYCQLDDNDEPAVMEYAQCLSARLFKFDDPEEFGYVTTSSLWRQRVVCQTVSLYLEYYSQMLDAGWKKKRFLCLIPNVLQLSRGIQDTLAKKIMPVLIEALPLLSVAKESKESQTAGLLLDSVRELLGNRRLESPELSSLSVHTLLESILAILKAELADVNVTLTALDCLLALASINSKGLQLKTFVPRVIQCLMMTSRSSKRLVRLKSAAARNAWELLRE